MTMAQSLPIIRAYKENDKAGLVECLEGLCDYLVNVDPLKKIRRLPAFGRTYTQSLLKKIVRNNGALYVADDNGEIVGIIAGIVQNVSKLDQLSFASTKYGRVLELFVHPDYRGNHLGKLLVEKMEDHFKQLHCDHLRIEVFEPNKSAHQFYHALGYTDRVIDVIKEL